MPASSLGLVGRDGELAVLDGLARAVVAGEGGSCVVAGPAGIGKTALVTAFLARAEQHGARVLRARGSELEGALSFGAVRDLLGPAVLRLPPREQDHLLRGPAGLARPVLGLEGGGAGDPLHGLFWLCYAIAEQQPLLLAVDDLHWLDQESAGFLAYLARRVEGLPILLVATAQTHVEGPAAAAMASVVASSRVVELAPLTEAQVADLVPGRPPAEVHRLTGGNPMLAVELDRALGADPAADLASVELRGVGAGILRRVHHLSPDAVALARAVALSPQRLGLGDAGALAGIEDPQQVAAAADALVRADVLEWDGERIGFLHPLMRTAVYDDLEPLGRRAAHGRAAAVLLDRGADAETVAAQLLAAEPAGAEESVRLLVAAADEADKRLAPRAVATYLERALAEPPADPAERVRLRHRLGRVLLDLGRTEAVDVLTRALEDAGDDRAAVAVDLARAYHASGHAERAAEVLRPLLVASPTTDDELDVAATWLLARTDYAPGQGPDGGIRPDLPGTTPVQRRAMVALAMYRQTGGAPASQVAPLVSRIVGDLGAHSLFDEARWYLLAAFTQFDDLEALAEAELRRARRTGEAARYATAQLRLAISANQQGRLRDCEAALRLGLEAPQFEGWWRFSLDSWLITTLSMQGRFDEAESMLAETLERAGESDNIGFHLDTRRAELATDRGDYAAVIEPGERALATITDGWFSAVGCDLAVALAAVGRRERGETLARAMLAAAERGEHPQAIGIACCALGRVVGGEEGLALLRRAVAVLSASPYRWNQANAEVALGIALRAAGRRSEAREVLSSALEYAVANDAAPIEQAAREELRLCGARPRRAARTGAAALTPAEERIARLAAEGRSNKEIAQHLFVTVKNVEMHLVHAYRKLEISSRRELARALSDGAAASSG